MQKAFKLFGLMALVTGAHAQDVFGDLGESVAVASRSELDLLAIPRSVDVISQQRLLLERTIPEALSELPGVLVQKTTHGHGSPYIRGFTGRQNLLMIDGIRVNNSTFRSGPIQYWNTLDSKAVERLELLRGPGSVLHGSDALGGTLNVISRGPNFRDYQGSFSGGSAWYRYDSNSESHQGRVETYMGQGGKWGLLLGVGKKDFGDLRDSAVGVFKRTGYDEENLDVKFEYALNDSTTLTFAHQYLNQDDVWRWHSTEYNDGWFHGDYATDPGDLAFRIYDQERSLTYFRVEGASDRALMANWQATFSYQKSQDSETRPGRFGVADVDTFGLAFQASGELGEGSLVWGADYYRDDVNTDASEPRRRPIADDSNYDSLGVFAQYQWQVSEKWELTAGARASYFKARWGKLYNRTLAQDESGDGDWSDLSLSAQALYRVSATDSAYFSIAQGFRAPNLDDLSGSNVSNSSDEVVGSTDLDPEKVVSFELGHRRVSDSVRWNVAAFYTLIDDPIVRVPDNTVVPNLVRMGNGEEGYLFGLEAEAAWLFNENWELSGHFTYQDGKAKKLDEIGGTVTEDTIRRLSPLAASVALKWTSTDQRYWIQGKVIAAATQDNLAAGDFGDGQRIPVSGTKLGTPSYVIASLYSGWNVNDSLELTLGLENITDEDYRVHGSGVNGQGFNVGIGAKYSW